MANWFDFLNKEKTVLRKHYDLKLLTTSGNNSGDSGVGEFLCNSSFSSLSSSLSNSQNPNQQPISSSQLLASLSVASLANISIFENEEYFSYYHKLLQQFNFIEFNLTSFNVNHEKYEISCFGLLPPTPHVSSHKQKPAIPSKKPANNSSQKRSSNTTQQQSSNTATLPTSPSTPSTLNTSTSNTGVLKSISKRFNIKSWFSNGNQNASSNTVNQSATNLKTSQSSTSNKLGQTTPPPSMNKLSIYDTTPTTKCCQNITQSKTLSKAHHAGTKPKEMNKASNLSLMKHSLSEPSLNALIN